VAGVAGWLPLLPIWQNAFSASCCFVVGGQRHEQRRIAELLHQRTICLLRAPLP
jgi:hypothetical protein